jgi:hypothetical protein
MQRQSVIIVVRALKTNKKQKIHHQSDRYALPHKKCYLGGKITCSCFVKNSAKPKGADWKIDNLARWSAVLYRYAVKAVICGHYPINLQRADGKVTSKTYEITKEAPAPVNKKRAPHPTVAVAKRPVFTYGRPLLLQSLLLDHLIVLLLRRCCCCRIGDNGLVAAPPNRCQ